MFSKFFLGVFIVSAVEAFIPLRNGLNINCWTGESTKSLSQIHPDVKFVGIDKHATVIEVANRRYPSNFFANLDIEEEGLDVNDFFDIVHISRYSNLETMLNNVWSIVRNGGIITIQLNGDKIEYLQTLLKTRTYEYYYYDDEKIVIMK